MPAKLWHTIETFTADITLKSVVEGIDLRETDDPRSRAGTRLSAVQS